MMVRSPTVPRKVWKRVGNLYLSGLPMREVAAHLNTSIDAIAYVLRKTEVPRRSFAEAQRLVFETKTPSFHLRGSLSKKEKEVELTGAMLYWAEGYKRDTASGIDFANSDPEMINMFLQFLRARYVLNTNRLHCSVYCYKNQDLESLIKTWSRILGLSRRSFKNHYIKQNFKTDSRQLPYGVLHVRYNDKKLLQDVLNLIESYKRKYLLR